MSAWEQIGNALAQEFSDLPDFTGVVQIVVRLSVAAVLGGLLGWNRERSGKSAGLRTHMLVGLGAALFVIIPMQAGVPLKEMSRVIQGIIVGIGFIGGGAILKLSEQRQIKGLTTAAGIWLTAAVGVGAGLGRLVSAILGALLAFVILSALARVEQWLSGDEHVHETDRGEVTEHADGHPSKARAR